MCSDDGQHTFSALILAREEVLSGLQQSREGGKEFAVRDFATELSPAHFNRIEPRAVGGEVQ